MFCEIWTTGDCDWGSDAEPYLRDIFLFLLLPQIIVEMFQIFDYNSSKKSTKDEQEKKQSDNAKY